MDAFVGLLKKEWKLSRLSMLVGLAILVTIQILAYFLSLRFEEPMIFFITNVVFLFLHVFYFCVFFGISIHGETKQLQMWLHTPQRISSLVTAKYIITFVGYIFSFTIVAITTRLSYELVADKLDYVNLFTIENTIGSTILLFLGSFSLGILVFFFTALNLWQKKYIRRFQGLTLVFMILILFIAVNFFEQSAFFKFMTSWFQISLPITESISFSGSDTSVGRDVTFYFGDALYRIGKSVFLFCFSCYLIDKKVEV
ncbi:hypothetical protein ACFSO7_03690 [Bacillus sp. CGMCC 1.16607]|uniref:hypothetical protein n=1 Tax=Bacillus sp. CGMCC 1.16607 TaxID=3351842 RepID=UPI0036326F2B